MRRIEKHEHCFTYYETGKERICFSHGRNSTISYKARWIRGKWHDIFYITDKEIKTLSGLRDIDYDYEVNIWRDAIDKFAKGYV